MVYVVAMWNQQQTKNMASYEDYEDDNVKFIRL